MSGFAAFNIRKWIDENRHLLKPPVGNKQIWTEVQDFIVMVVGGPNSRTDYHYNESEEFFYQLEGDVAVRLQVDGKAVEVPIREGDIFLLPAGVPHSPQRGPDTVGIVIEKVRTPDMKDGLLWFCPSCNHKLYEEYFHMTNIATQMQPVFEKFYASADLRTCQKCGTVLQPPDKYKNT
jgi:3-hydroxyanthranilate 3,4-dioxygenase